MNRRKRLLYELQLIALWTAVLVITGFMRTQSFIVSPLGRSVIKTLVLAIYQFCLAGWVVSIHRRVYHQGFRMGIFCLYVMVCAWFVLRTLCQDVFIQDFAAKRTLWYLYQVPFILIPVVDLQCWACIGSENRWRMSPYLKALWGGGILLCLLALTNDWHQLFFRINPDGNIGGWGALRSLFLLSSLWRITLVGSGLAYLYRRCTVPASKKLIWKPFTIMLLGHMRLVYSYMHFKSFDEDFIEILAMFVAVNVALIESTLQTGLCISNTRHEGIFASSTFPWQITDQDYNERYSSAITGSFDKELLKEALLMEVRVEEHVRLRGAPIRGGYVFWKEDMSAVEKTLEELAETQALLKERNEVIQAEIRLNKRRSRIRAQNELYDKMVRELWECVNHMQAILTESIETEGEARQVFKRACLEGSYFKRRSNLLLLEEKGVTDFGKELEYCIRESCCNISVDGQAYSYVFIGRAFVSASLAKAAYDLFQKVIRQIYDREHAVKIMVELRKEGLGLWFEAGAQDEVFVGLAAKYASGNIGPDCHVGAARVLAEGRGVYLGLEENGQRKMEAETDGQEKEDLREENLRKAGRGPIAFPEAPEKAAAAMNGEEGA